MINKAHIEKFYDYFDMVANILYEQNQLGYIEGMNVAFDFLLDREFEYDLVEDDMERIYQVKKVVENTDFNPEEVRKAVQLGILKGFKHTYETNAKMTPDSIGLFMGYLVSKLYPDLTEINSILDPMMGTGNLIYTICNQLEIRPKVIGVDDDILQCRLARNFGDLLSIDNEIFYQDTRSYLDKGFDVVCTDLAIFEKKDPYLPYQIINHTLNALNQDKFLIALIENDFFEQKDSDVFKEEIHKKAHVFGLIKLSESLFSKHPKSILILQKKQKEPQNDKGKFLLVDLPSFTDNEAFSHTIKQIDQWFLNRKENEQ
ncbi:MAG: hypothetical protein UMR38_07350 [Candidatus Izemoplasma sp.]|nr:hypothetical protein [Candidatus Izemoplasma sp.]